MKRLLDRATFVAALALVAAQLFSAETSEAAFTPPSPQAGISGGPINQSSAGQGDLIQSSGVGNGHVFVDWVVMQYNPAWNATLIANSALTSNTITRPTNAFAGATSAAYLYLYQVENPSSSTPADRLSISVDNSFVLGGGALAGTNFADLDVDGGPNGIGTILPGVPGNNSTNFPFLAGEFEPDNIKTTGYQFDNFDASGVIGWDFLLPAGSESITLWMVSSAPPVFGVARVQDGVQWNDDQKGEPVVVPNTAAPEPASVVVWSLLVGIFGCVALKRRTHGKSSTRMSKVALIAVVLIGIVVSNCSISNAAPEPASPGVYPSQSAAGQSTLIQTTGSSSVFVDWIVMPYNTAWNSTLIANSTATSNSIAKPTNPFAGATSSAYLYLYQLENPSGSSIADRLSLTLDNSLVFGGGALATNLDLDGAGGIGSVLTGVPGHNSTNFSLLGSPAAESEPASLKTTGFTFDSVAGSGAAGWDFALPADTQTAAFWLVSNTPPSYGLAFAQDSVQWNNDGHGDGVPIPVPEPSTLLLSVLGFGILAGAKRRFRHSA